MTWDVVRTMVQVSVKSSEDVVNPTRVTWDLVAKNAQISVGGYGDGLNATGMIWDVVKKTEKGGWKRSSCSRWLRLAAVTGEIHCVIL